MWKLEIYGSIISTKMRKIVVKKYLSLHLSYFYIKENSTGVLFTKLSIDTTQLYSIFLTLVGDILQTLGNLITGLVKRFVYDYKLALISLIFIPFIIFALVMIKDSVLSFNFQKNSSRYVFRLFYYQILINVSKMHY